MPLTLADAKAFFASWAAFSKEALQVLAPSCPPVTNKVKKFDATGPRGVLFHYTGGPDGLASLRWGNENPANKGSSWHATVFKARLPKLEELLASYPLVSQYLPATALLHANVDKGTWHGNWTNAYLWGIENENLGLLTMGKDGKPYRPSGSNTFYPKLSPVYVRGQWWDAWTREQIQTNVNLGRLFRAYSPAADPSWFLPHSAVYGKKSDTGSAFPLTEVRWAIFDESIDLASFNSFVSADPCDPDDATCSADAFLDEARDTEEPVVADAVDFDTLEGDTWQAYLPGLRWNLSTLGYYLPDPESESTELEAELKTAVTILQRSSHYEGGPNLTVDGVPGPKTRDFVEKRLRDFGFKV